MTVPGDYDQFDKAIYSAKIVAQVSGLGSTLIQQYSDRELLRYESVQVGNRTYRRFTYLDVVAAALLSVLKGMGVSPLEASEICKDGRAAIAQWVCFRHPGSLLGAAVDENWKQTRFFVIPEGCDGVLFHSHTSIGEAMERAPYVDPYGGLSGGFNPAKVTFGRPAGFTALDLQAIVEGVNAKLAELEGTNE